MPTTRIETIHKRIERIKADLVAIDEMRPGSVSKQFKNPELAQGAYYQLNYSQGGRSRTEYVAPDVLRDVRRQISNYKRFKALTGERVERASSRAVSRSDQLAHPDNFMVYFARGQGLERRVPIAVS